jgi:hypothetical protein
MQTGTMRFVTSIRLRTVHACRFESIMDRASAVESAHRQIKAAALQIADVSKDRPDLERLASEVMTMACVAEIVAYALRDEGE